MMASSTAGLCSLLLLALLLLATPTLSSPSTTSVRASSEHRRRVVDVDEKPPAQPPAVAPVPVPGRARQEFHVAPTTGPIGQERRRRRRSRARGGGGGGGGTGAWTFSAMLPRGFVPPSGSSACHNDMPDTAADARFFACTGAGAP